MNSAITLEAVSKRYRLVHGRPLLVKSLLPGRRRQDELWALRDVSFECAPGDTLGVIGRNGSGKTTLLRLLAGVTAPTLGRLRVWGRIAPLIGVGVGFDPELTGRENVYVNAQLLGLSTAQVTQRFDDIVAFSELGHFLETAVKYYSSGMFLRLAFAVAIHTEPEVLLVDELLAVGDLAFQTKCFDRMTEMQRNGTTIVVVTHNLDTVHRMCHRAIVLSRGQVVCDGDPEDAIASYHDVMHQEAVDDRSGSILQHLDGGPPLVGGASVEATVLDANGNVTRALLPGAEFWVEVEAHFAAAVHDPCFAVTVAAAGRGLLYISYTTPGDYRGDHGPESPLRLRIRMNNHLLSGSYTVQAAVLDPEAKAVMGISRPQSVAVLSMGRSAGVVDLQAHYQVDGRSVAVTEHVRLGNDRSSPA